MGIQQDFLQSHKANVQKNNAREAPNVVDHIIQEMEGVRPARSKAL
jgi:hypothetical protein